MSILIWTMLWFWDVNWVELSWCFAVRAVFLLLGLVFQWRISFVILCKVANRGKWFMAAKKLSQFQLMLQSNVKLKSKKAFIVRQANIFLVFILYLKMWCIWKNLCFFFLSYLWFLFWFNEILLLDKKKSQYNRHKSMNLDFTCQLSLGARVRQGKFARENIN